MKRWTPLALVSLVALLLAPSYATTPACTIRGTNGSDTLFGTSGSDVICGKGGNDFIDGQGGNDIMRGGFGSDTISDNTGHDIFRGNRGNDSLFATDSQGGDRLIGGQEFDRCFGDQGDSESGCEL